MLREVPTLFGDSVTTHSYTIVFPIDGVDYLFAFTYNPRMDRWVLDITNSATGDAVIVGAVMVYNVDFFTYASPGLRPRGTLLCTWKGEAPDAAEPGEFDLGKTCQLFYFERPEDLFFSAPEEPPQA